MSESSLRWGEGQKGRGGWHGGSGLEEGKKEKCREDEQGRVMVRGHGGEGRKGVD